MRATCALARGCTAAKWQTTMTLCVSIPLLLQTIALPLRRNSGKNSLQRAVPWCTLHCMFPCVRNTPFRAFFSSVSEAGGCPQFPPLHDILTSSKPDTINVLFCTTPSRLYPLLFQSGMTKGCLHAHNSYIHQH